MTTNATCEPDAQRIEADIAALATLTNPDREGWTRQVFTDPYRSSRDWVEHMMRDAGLDVRRDGVGNLIGVLAGSAPSAPPIVTGSHTDTVSGGGRFDGVVGVLGRGGPCGARGTTGRLWGTDPRCGDDGEHP